MDYIYHYTAINTLPNLLHTPTEQERNIMVDNDDNPDYGYYLDFHATDLHLMNDRQENRLITDVLNQVPGELALANGVADWVQGKPYIVSFCKQRDYIPMWQMYANQKKGICLKFRRDGLVEDIQKINASQFADIKMEECTYLTENKFRQRGREVKKVLKQFSEALVPGQPIFPEQRNIPDFKKESVFLKLDSFEYEQEVRLAVFTSDVCLVKDGRYGIGLYYPVKIPLRHLEEIIVGPSTYQDILRYSVAELLKNKNIYRLDNYDINIKVSVSRLRLR